MTPFARETLRYLGNAAPDERLLALIASVEAELRDGVRPRGVYRRLPIDVEGGRVLVSGHAFESKALADTLRGCGEAFFVAATLGAEADRLLRRHAALDLPRAAVWQAACAAHLEAYVDDLEARLFAQAPGMFPRPRFSPGYGDLDISSQWAMFALLDLERRLGLSLTEACMMLPEKSVTAIIGVGRAPCDAPRGCDACDNIHCPNRRTNA